MADIPTPRSYPQIFGDALDVFLSKAQLRGVKKGGPIWTSLDTIATSQARTSSDTFKMLASRDVDALEGEALTNAGYDEGLKMLPATYASTLVTIGDSSFTKVGTRLYQGAPAPVAGASTLFVVDGSQFPLTGTMKLYLGRGTTNLEGPLTYTACVQDVSGAFWRVTLATPLVKPHAYTESVVLAQGGDRAIPSGTVVSTPGTATPVLFATVSSVVLPDGENTLAGVRVVCQESGVNGNVAAGAIQSFPSAPFLGATVLNPNSVTNAAPAESKEQFRERIKASRRTKVKGTGLAVTASVYRATAQDQQATVTSSSLLKNTLYIDDGTGYEPIATGVAIETLVDQAAGGETDLQIMGGLPVARAYVQASANAPYTLSDGSQLAALVGGIPTIVTFSKSSFRDITAANAYEVASAINASPNSLVSARTANSGTSVTLFARSALKNEDVQVTTPSTAGVFDANRAFNFPTARFETVRLFKNDAPLAKDGLAASLTTTPQSSWQSTIGILTGGVPWAQSFPYAVGARVTTAAGTYDCVAGGNSAATGAGPAGTAQFIADGQAVFTPAKADTLTLNIDNTGFTTYAFTALDFSATGLGATTVSASNSLGAWAAVLNAKIPGVTTTVVGSTLVLRSNASNPASSSLVIDPSRSTLVAKGMFGTSLSATGRGNDYILNPNTGEITLTVPLQRGDRITAGTPYARSYLETADFTSISVGPSGATLWFVVDGSAKVIGTGVSSSTTLTVTLSGGLLTLTGPAGIFANLQPQDAAILWDPAFGVLRGIARVSAVDPNNAAFVQLGQSLAPVTNPPATVTPSAVGLVFVRTAAQIQPLVIPAGVVTPATVSSLASAQITGATSSTPRSSRFRLTTDTVGPEGDMALVAADVGGSLFTFTAQTSVNSPARFASVEAGTSDRGTPVFTVARVTGSSGNGDFNFSIPYSDGTFVAAPGPTWSNLGFQIGYGLAWTSIGTSATLGSASLLGETPRITGFSDIYTFRGDTGYTYTGGDLTFTAPADVPSSGDWAYCCSPYLFAPEDTLNVIFDQDSVGKALSLPMAYTVGVAGATPGYYGANVLVTAPDHVTPLTTAFGPSFDFSGYFLYPRPRAYTDPPPNTTLTSTPISPVLWRLRKHRPGRVNLAYTNPTAPSQGLTITAAPNNSNSGYSISVGLPSGVARSITPGLRYATGVTTGYASNSTAKQVNYFCGLRATVSVTSGQTCTASFLAGNAAYGNAYLTNHQFQAGDVFYLANGTAFPAGFCTVGAVTSPTAFTFTYNNLGQTPALGTAAEIDTLVAALGPTPVVPSLAGVSVGDIVTIGTGSSLDPSSQGTYRIVNLDTTYGLWFTVIAASATAFPYRALGAPSNLQIYPIDTTQTNTAGSPNIATRVNALPGNLWVDAAIPAFTLNGTAVPGSPVSSATLDVWLGDITKPRYGPSFWADRYSVVSSAPVGGNYQLTINAANYYRDTFYSQWTCDEDWANEYPSLVPTSATAMAKFLAMPAVSGIATVAEVKAVARARKLQLASLTPGAAGSVQVTGGTANGGAAAVFDSAVTSGSVAICRVRASDAIGLMGGHTVAFQGTIPSPRNIGWNASTTLSVTPGAGSTTIAITGGAGAIATYTTRPPDTALPSSSWGPIGQGWKVQRQGQYMAYTASIVNQGFSQIAPGDWMRVTFTNGSAANQVLARVVQASYDPNATLSFTCWIENPNGVEEAATMAIEFFAPTSILPGDTVVINTPILGAAAIGSWTVQAVGGLVPTGASLLNMVVAGVLPATAGTTLGPDYSRIQVLPTAPSRLIKRLAYVGPAPDGIYSYLGFTPPTALNEISAAAGTVVQPLDKFSFPTTMAVGLDGYRYHTGLVGECNRILYGDPSDSDTYPGVVAKGASLAITGPLIKRIQLSLSVRVRQGTSKDVLQRVQGAVAAVVNTSGVGRSISLADVVTAARKVQGVVGVTVIYPAYGPGMDQIAVMANEKPVVLNVDSDIQVTLTGL